ncbi:MAG: phytanoyl-CoA dioxygenase family protein [Planctomycetota bacterium]|nr:phytanoyl-CoA dioxygenase family protein [Planctomycetota bacterium]
MAEAVLFEKQVAVEHAPELYTVASSAAPLRGLAAVADEQVARYRRDGFLAVEGALSEQEVEDARAGLHDLIVGRNPEFKGVLFEAAAKEKLETLSETERELAVRKVFNFIRFDPRLDLLAKKPELLAVAAKLMGGAEPELFQDMALVKPPKIGREKPWHQDCAYFNYPVGTAVVGVWIALDEATVANGCMHVLSGGHREGPKIHFNRRDWQICDREMLGRQAVAVPLKPGGALFFDGLLPHGTPTNHSDQRRRALQFHYAPANVSKMKTEERLAIYGSEGKDVSC